MAARNPYDVLGVSPSADEDSIRNAFRRLAKQYHPDRNAGDARAEARFKEVATAYGIVGDPDRRRRFDRGEIGNDGAERAFAGAGAGGPFGGAAGGGSPFGGGFRGGFGGADIEELLGSIFGNRGGARGGPRADEEPPEATTAVRVPFVGAVFGTSVRVETPAGRTIELKIKPGTADGTILRLRGQGAGGDLLVKVEVEPHPRFRREGDDVTLDLPVTLGEAVLGGKVPAPTVDGTVMVSVPAGSSSGRMLRLRGKGVPRADGTRGDQLVRLMIALPDRPDPELTAAIARWSETHPYDPRGDAD